MKKRYAAIIILLAYIIGFTGMATPTYAQEDNSNNSAGAVGFSYNVIKPENQRPTNVSYFDLRMTPGQKQTVKIELANSSSEEKEIIVGLNGAKTNGNGVIEYASETIDNDKSLKYDFADIVKGPESVKVPAGAVVPLELEIEMPKSSYDGMIAGGIQLKEAVDEEGRKKQTGVINEYAFMIGMVLTETDTVVEPELELNDVYAGLSNFRNSVFVNFSNIEAAILNDLTMDVQITEKGSDAVLYDTKKANLRVGPNNLVDFPVSMNGEKMEPGDYRAIIVATAGDRRWNWEREFTITDEEADKYNQQDVNLDQEQGINWLLVGMIVGGGILLGAVIFLIVRVSRKRTTKKNMDKKKKKRPVKK